MDVISARVSPLTENGACALENSGEYLLRRNQRLQSRVQMLRNRVSEG